MRDPFGEAPSAAEIQALATKALAAIPDHLKRHLGGIAILVEDFPDDETMATMALDSPFGLLGLYHGVSLDQKSVGDAPEDIDRIYLYRRPLLDLWCEGGDSLEDIVHNTIVHEIGHHFGLSDDDMERLESGDDDGA
ncbi:MAG: metallopeptidase family protein [Alphaproteobacteria bacterium]|jgi:predicted Zn-dependent protease with MMP-like domain